MTYLRKSLNAETSDTLRINLSAQPVKMSPEPVCDFCGAENPEWVYAATRMTTGERVQCWRWTACPECAGAIEAEDWKTLVERTTTKLFEMTGGKIPADGLRFSAWLAITAFHRDAIRGRE